jgi:cell division septation protein DedD
VGKAHRHISLGFALSAVVVALAFSTGVAMASSSTGEITGAEASPDWTAAHLAGSASWTGCGVSESSDPSELLLEGPLTGGQAQAPCYWQPFVTVGPGETEADCEENSRLPWSSDETVSVAWAGVEVSIGGTQSFDLPEVPLGGAPGQLACLGFVETIYNTCVPTEGRVCPMWFSATHVGVLDSASLDAPETIIDPEEPEGATESPLKATESQQQPPAESTAQATPPAETPPAGNPLRPSCPRGQQRVARRSKAVCRHRHRHRQHGGFAHN